ncbi:minor tail protein [Gordonia phage Pons]|uniref:Minor tail protein n=2 Tax=Ponsvirus TaxID=3044795 RepID=A0AAE8Y5Y9_9CAUD|nr:minor tail protein [Gordonia phage Pons]YP_010663079.1 minor tail protein [Gordonia phage Mayweather]QDP45180.1 minor tail protein [Gordonia phage Mayweather]UDL15177.1 minor tail protein [Gordonia phage Pons]
MSNWKVTLTTPDGEEMVVHPEHEATHGVYLAEDQVKGDIIDAPVKTEWDSLALQEGGTQRGVDAEYRDIDMGFHVTDNKISAEEADSMLRMMFDYEDDEWDPNPIRQTRVDLEIVGGPFTGSLRSLDVLMHDTPETELSRDPLFDQYTNPLYHFRAGQPMWYQPTVIKAFTWTGTGTINGFVEVENPTDRAMRHSWVVAAPPGARVTLPDVSWVGPRGKRVIGGPDPTRTIPLPQITAAHGGGFRVTLERGKVMVEDKNGTNVMGQMPIPGKTFLYRIPPYTRKTLLPVKIENAPAGGGRIELRQPRLWSRPYGLEMW